MSNKEIDGEANGGEEEVKTDPPKEKVSQGEVEKIIDFLNSNTKYRVVTEEEFELLKGPQLKSTPKDTFPPKIQRPLQRRLLPSVADITHNKTEVPPVIGVWVLVVFLEEDVLSHPIRLEEVQDSSGRNGVEADLQVGNRCMARYYVGDQMHAALIYKRSENPEELKKEYERIMEMMKQRPNEESKFWHYSKVIGGGMLVGGLAVAAAPVALSAAGFTAVPAATTSGTLAGTLAARLMSMAAMASGGRGAAAASTGGWFAAAQSAGAAGLSATTNLLIGSTAGTLGGFFASRFGKKNTSEQGQLPDKSQGLPTGTRNDMNDNQTFRNPSFAESRKTADLLADIYQSNNIQTSQRESCSSLDSTDQNQDEEYLSANIQNISLNADEAEQLHCQNQHLQEEENQCKICLDSEMDTLFEPCGHLCTCRSCASMLRVCPICRNHIKKLHRVYRS